MQYSVVIPLKNEAENIVAVIDELEPIMNTLTGRREQINNVPNTLLWELICVDDGSTDNTPLILAKLAKDKPYLRILRFTKNCGQSSAFDAGFKASKAEIVITLDGDGQNDPHDIPKLVQMLKESPCDLVCGYRMKRKDTAVKKCTSFFANKIRSRVCQDGIRDTGCSLKAYRRECLINIKMFNGMHRFLPALFHIEGFTVKEIPVKHRSRMRGKSHYNFFNRSLNTVFDLFAVWWMRKRRLKYQIDKIL